MFMIFGFGHTTTKDFGKYKHENCNNCNNLVEWNLLKITSWFTLFFIPIIPYSVKYCSICPICKSSKFFTKSQFNLILTNNLGLHYYDDNEYSNNTDKYAGKTETQKAYLSMMDEVENKKNK